MPDNLIKISRRSFLKVGGVGLATIASRPVWTQGEPEAGVFTRNKPAEPLVLRSGTLELVLDRKDGLPYEYHLRSGKSRFIGEDLGAPLKAVICDRTRWAFRDVALAAARIRYTSSQADFHFNATDENKPAASFMLRYRVDEATVHITLDDVQEQPGYELIQVELPRLVTVREEDGAAWLAHGDTGGSLASLREATPGRLRPNTFWGNVLATLPVVMVGTSNALCVQEVTSYMDETVLSVDGEKGKRRASLGTVKVHRVNGSLSYDMNTGTPATRFAGNKKTPNMLIGQKSACRLDFITQSKANATWLDGAKLVRQRMPLIPTHYYDDKLVYGIHCDEPKYERPPATFQQCEKLIRDVALLTDNAAQVVHLWGWQYRGKDTGYPAVAEVNKRVGSYEELMQLMQDARSSNCNVTFSDNYDDAYRSSPAWDPGLIAKRPDGELWESRNWTGENSYIMGLAKYMQGPGVDRVRYTCERYKLRETAHVDVLSYYSIRNDWDHEKPASGVKNLVEGRYRVMEEFAKRGVDVSSEALRYAFVGKMSYYWHMPTPSPCPFGGKPIPLLPMIYRQSAIWGDWGRNREYPAHLLNMLFYNACPHLSITTSSSPAEITDLFYLMMVPWFKLQSRNIESFLRQDERTLIGLQGNSEIDLDWQNKTYKVTIDGVEVARDGSTFCPLDDHRLSFYSLAAKDLTALLPKGWNPASITARVLTKGGSQDVPMAVEGGRVRVTVPAQQPVIVYRDHKEQTPNA
jgi:hypothetical protein